MAIGAITQTFTATGVGTFSPVSATAIAIKGVANLTLGGSSPVGTVKLEKSYDGGTTWFDVSIDSVGTLASWVLAAATEISVLIEEPEGGNSTSPSGVLYRCNCTAYTSGTITARISQ